MTRKVNRLLARAVALAMAVAMTGATVAGVRLGWARLGLAAMPGDAVRAPVTDIDAQMHKGCVRLRDCAPDPVTV